MSKHLKYNISLLLTLLLSFTSCATTGVNWDGKISSRKSSYSKEFTKFRKKLCRPNTKDEFEKLLKAYRGQGYWIPELNGDVDVESITHALPQIEKKLTWISQEKNKLIKRKKLPTKKITAPIHNLVKSLLELKKTEISTNESSKIKARQKSLALQKTLMNKYEALLDEVSFLRGFSYPVDHLKNRQIYDEHRVKGDIESRKISNRTFLLRKTYEDGAYNPDHTGSDIYLRTTLDTVHFELKKHGFYLTEDARFDLEFVLEKIEKELERKNLVDRLTEWEDRTRKTLDFYRSLTLPENRSIILVNGKQTTRNQELIKEHNRAIEKLKEFTYSRQAEVYKYWLGESELHRAIFVLETTLMNEVGPVDGPDALERMDVARVVMNRLDKPKYLKIESNEFIYPHLRKIVSEETIEKETWLNALFKQGEFSFTYYYMSSSADIYCPDIAPRARRLRDQNITLALNALKEKDSEFKATRYFSRSSMIGRIHMDSVWNDYVLYPERAGLVASQQKKLRELFQQGKYTYLYSFKDPKGELYEVLKLDGKTYAVGETKKIKIFYKYRNIHSFKYFTKL